MSPRPTAAGVRVIELPTGKTGYVVDFGEDATVLADWNTAVHWLETGLGVPPADHLARREAIVPAYPDDEDSV